MVIAINYIFNHILRYYWWYIRVYCSRDPWSWIYIWRVFPMLSTICPMLEWLRLLKKTGCRDQVAARSWGGRCATAPPAVAARQQILLVSIPSHPLTTTCGRCATTPPAVGQTSSLISWAIHSLPPAVAARQQILLVSIPCHHHRHH